MAAMTVIDIARIWAASFKADRLMLDWAMRNYGREFFFQIGADMRRPPDGSNAPFISIFPDTEHTGPQAKENSHELGLVVGIDDDVWLAKNGVTEMQALIRLNELCPLLRKAMSMALVKARVQNVTIEYEILQFPLVMALFSVTVEETLPVGGRR